MRESLPSMRIGIEADLELLAVPLEPGSSVGYGIDETILRPHS